MIANSNDLSLILFIDFSRHISKYVYLLKIILLLLEIYPSTDISNGRLTLDAHLMFIQNFGNSNNNTGIRVFLLLIIIV